MKKLLQMNKFIVYMLCLVTVNTYAQDTIKKTNSIGKFDEQFMVLKSDKKVKQGSYRLYNNKKLVASGLYDHGKRIGTWSFYNNDQLEQRYDYNSNKIIMDASDKSVTCEIDDAAPGDAVKKAVKIGGYNGIAFLAAYAKFDENESNGENKVTHVLSLDGNGKITSWSASIKNTEGLKIIHPDYTSIPDEIIQFLPATLNGKNTASTITVHMSVVGENNEHQFGEDGPKKRTGKKSKTP